MSTRSAIARKTNNGFRGVYHHWDGYPTGLGATLFQLFNGHFEQRLEPMLKYLIDEHPAGWSTINGADFSKPPGYGDRSATQCYCHGTRNEGANPITEANASGSGCEWVYVFSEENGQPVMEILSSYHPYGGKMIGWFGSGNPNAEWYAVGRVFLTEAAPDWEKIENFEPVQPILN